MLSEEAACCLKKQRARVAFARDCLLLCPAVVMGYVRDFEGLAVDTGAVPALAVLSDGKLASGSHEGSFTCCSSFFDLHLCTSWSLLVADLGHILIEVRELPPWRT